MSTRRRRKKESAGQGSREEQLADQKARRRPRRIMGRGDFNPDYSYIKKDLRRIALLTGFFLIILIALSFIIPT